MDKSGDGTVHLPQALVEDAQRLAEMSLQRFTGVQGFYRNTSNSHLVGKLGELLIERILTSAGWKVDSVFREVTREKECDLIAGEIRLEVKTWNFDYWEPWGRCIAVTQLPTIRRKADVLLWVTVSSPHTPPVYGAVRGWNYVEDFDGLEPLETGPASSKVLNYQMPISEVRPQAAFFELLRNR